MILVKRFWLKNDLSGYVTEKFWSDYPHTVNCGCPCPEGIPFYRAQKQIIKYNACANDSNMTYGLYPADLENFVEETIDFSK